MVKKDVCFCLENFERDVPRGTFWLQTNVWVRVGPTWEYGFIKLFSWCGKFGGNAPAPGAVEKMSSKKEKQKITFVAVGDLAPSNFQPRTMFDEAKIAELAQSLLEHGILQPLIVREVSSGKYEIIAGERRFRAAKIAAFKTVPCIVMNLVNDTALAIALVENIQREDLNPIEEAFAYKRLKEALKLGQEEIAERVGKDRASVANVMRLLKLPKNVQQMVVEESLSMGHARALLALDSADLMMMVAKKTIREGLSVRRVEGLIRSIKSGYHSSEFKKIFTDNAKAVEPMHREIQQKLEHVLGTKVNLRKEMNGFSLVIHFSGADQLNGLLDSLGVEI